MGTRLSINVYGFAAHKETSESQNNGLLLKQGWLYSTLSNHIGSFTINHVRLLCCINDRAISIVNYRKTAW